jgi:hypothetical protein
MALFSFAVSHQCARRENKDMESHSEIIEDELEKEGRDGHKNNAEAAKSRRPGKRKLKVEALIRQISIKLIAGRCIPRVRLTPTRATGSTNRSGLCPALR